MAATELVTDHRIWFGDAREGGWLPEAAVDLIVTSPPYPMIEMWDGAFAELNQAVAAALAAGDGPAAFELMHQELDKVWRHCWQILKPGGIICINIGDAVRTLRGDFRIYPNHARIHAAMSALGFRALPDIIWRKPTNAPNKFLGSGTLPPSAYVTYEHEYILIFRKGGPRQFTATERVRRRASAFFWEERNLWFSDLWTDLRGAGQELATAAGRSRSAAYPFELPFRLICMYSLYGDLVFDPFLGTGTTTAAAMAAGRHSAGLEYSDSLAPAIAQTISQALPLGVARIMARHRNHLNFVSQRLQAGFRFKYENVVHHFPVMTASERELSLYLPCALQKVSDHHFRVKARLLTPQDAAASPSNSSLEE